MLNSMSNFWKGKCNTCKNSMSNFWKGKCDTCKNSISNIDLWFPYKNINLGEQVLYYLFDKCNKCEFSM